MRISTAIVFSLLPFDCFFNWMDGCCVRWLSQRLLLLASMLNIHACAYIYARAWIICALAFGKWQASNLKTIVLCFLSWWKREYSISKERLVDNKDPITSWGGFIYIFVHNIFQMVFINEFLFKQFICVNCKVDGIVEQSNQMGEGVSKKPTDSYSDNI